MKSPSSDITLHIMTQVQIFLHVDQSQNSYSLTNSLPPLPSVNDTSRKSHAHESMSMQFMQANSLSSTSATKIYINLEILEVNEIIDRCILLKLLITNFF